MLFLHQDSRVVKDHNTYVTPQRSYKDGLYVRLTILNAYHNHKVARNELESSKTQTQTVSAIYIYIWKLVAYAMMPLAARTLRRLLVIY